MRLSKVLQLVVIILFSFSSLQAKYSEEDFLITSKATDISLEGAKEKALTNLSQNIFVRVESLLITSEQVVDDNYSSKADIDTKISSQGFFKGVIFFNEKKIKSNQYEVFAGFSKKAYEDTIFFLKEQIILGNKDSLSDDALYEQYKKGSFLMALMSYGRASNLEFDNDYYNKLSFYIKDLNLKFSSDATLKFVANDENIKIILNNKEYKPYQEIYLASGIYNYQASLKGYVTKTGEIDVRRGDKVDYRLYLQKKLPKDLDTSLSVINKSNISSTDITRLAKEIMQQNQMKYTNTSKNKLIINIGNTNSNQSINDYYNISTSVGISLQGQYNISTNITVNYLSKNKTDKIPYNVFKAQVLEKTAIFFANLYN